MMIQWNQLTLKILCTRTEHLCPNDFDDTLTFHLVPSSGQMFDSSSTLIFDQMPDKK